MKKCFGVAIVSGVLIVLVSMFIGCSNELEDSQFGTLILTPGDPRCEIRPRTIQPRQELIKVTRYELSGVGPRGAAFGPRWERAPNIITIADLEAGTWRITIKGLNSEGTAIATETLTVTIFPSQRTDATFYLQWIEGVGNLDITVTWPSNVTTFARIHGVLSQNGNEIKTFDLMTENATISNSLKTITKSYTGMVSGSYNFVLTFFDSNETRVGLPYLEDVHIHDGLTSSGVCSIPEESLPIEPPVITPAGGRLPIGHEISISSASENVQIYYTLDGSTPTSSSLVYSDAIVLQRNVTVKAIALNPSRFASEVVSAEFQVPAAAPMFSVLGGSYRSPQTVTISSDTDGAVIYYTTDGTDPTEESEIYSTALTISEDTTLKAISIHPDYEDSAITTAEYKILSTLRLTIVDPPLVNITLQLPEGWEGTTVLLNSRGIATAVVTPEFSGNEVAYTWYVDGELARNTLGEIASDEKNLSFGDSDSDVMLSQGPHILAVRVTKGSMTYSDQKLINISPPTATCVVSFDSQGGSSPNPRSITVNEWKPYGTLPTVTQEGWIFNGWWTTPDDGGHRITEASLVTIASNHTLYARWRTPYDIRSIGPAGGWVFYENPNWKTDGWRYLEAAPYGWYDGDTDSRGTYTGEDDPRFQWGAGSMDIGYEVYPSATEETLGSGKTNTENIVTYHDNLGIQYPEKGDYYTNPTQYSDRNDGTVAAKVCLEYSLVKDDVTYDDWYLPSHGELLLMQSNLVLYGLGNFAVGERDSYWSSTEHGDIKFARTLRMSDPQPYSAIAKFNSYRIRPIRAF